MSGPFRAGVCPGSLPDQGASGAGVPERWSAFGQPRLTAGVRNGHLPFAHPHHDEEPDRLRAFGHDEHRPGLNPRKTRVVGNEPAGLGSAPAGTCREAPRKSNCTVPVATSTEEGELAGIAASERRSDQDDDSFSTALGLQLNGQFKQTGSLPSRSPNEIAARR
jgi:hypothetical protein